MRPRSIAPGVELFPVRTPTLPPATHTNTFAVGGAEVLLVEPATPYDDERRDWLDWARGIASQGRRLVGVFATHHHVDHGSAAGAFARALDVPLFAHPITFDLLHDLEGVRREPIVDEQPIALEGRRLVALHTPGHAPGHLCLHDPEGKTVIAGDMVANGSTILIPPDDGGDMTAYLEQLERLDALGATTLLPAHGEPFDDPHAVFAYYLEHRRMRERKVLSAFEAMRTSLGREPAAAELVPQAYDDAPMHVWPIARGAVEAHLVKLRREGRI